MMAKSALIQLFSFLFLLSCSRAGEQSKAIPYVIEDIAGRKVYIAAPPGKAPEIALPAVILLHGRGQTAGAWFDQGILSRGDQKSFPQRVLKSGMVALAPQALEPFGAKVKQWDFLHGKMERSHDLEFFQNLFLWMKENKKINFDLSRVYIVGISSGGFMASRLAHAFPDHWAAIIVVAGGNADSFNKIASFPLDDNPQSRQISPKHPPAMIIHGKKDLIVPFAYGEQYFNDLKQPGVKTDMIAIPDAGHRWQSQLHDQMLKWLDSHHKSESKENLVDKIQMDESFNGKSVILEMGDAFSLKLKGVPTAGYLWKIVEIDDDMIAILEERQETLTKQGLVGGDSLFIWRFQTRKKGNTRLVLKHFRPWEGADKASWTFSLDARIE